VAILSGGELTGHRARQCRGGPNQEYGLAFVDLQDPQSGISALRRRYRRRRRRAGLSERSAGAIIDQATFAKMKFSISIRAPYLANNDAPLLRRDGDLLLTGPDADQCQRHQGDFGGLISAVVPGSVKTPRDLGQHRQTGCAIFRP